LVAVLTRFGFTVRFLRCGARCFPGRGDFHRESGNTTVLRCVERFDPPAPRAGWLAMDNVNISGGLGGAFDVTSGTRNLLVSPAPAARKNSAWF